MLNVMAFYEILDQNGSIYDFKYHDLISCAI